MSNNRLTGTDAKQRRGNGWGGKGSFHPAAKTYGKVRRYVPYQSKPGRSAKSWQAGEKAWRYPRIAA